MSPGTPPECALKRPWFAFILDQLCGKTSYLHSLRLSILTSKTNNSDVIYLNQVTQDTPPRTSLHQKTHHSNLNVCAAGEEMSWTCSYYLLELIEPMKTMFTLISYVRALCTRSIKDETSFLKTEKCFTFEENLREQKFH